MLTLNFSRLKLVKLVAHGLAFVPLMWLVYGAMNRLLGGDPQEKVLHELGLWGLIFLLLSLSMTPAGYLFTKIPWVKFRRMLGLYSAFYLSLHLLMFLAFYLAFDISRLFDEIWERPYITVGFLAFVGLIPLVVTSTKSAQRRLGRKWKRLHQLVYPIAGLALVHFIWQSKSDLNEPLLYVIWALVLMVIRIGKNRASRQLQVNSGAADKSTN